MNEPELTPQDSQQPRDSAQPPADTPDEFVGEAASAAPSETSSPSVPTAPSESTAGRNESSSFSRRKFIVGSSVTVAGGLGAAVWYDYRRSRELVAVLRAEKYDASLVPLIREGLRAVGVDWLSIRGKSVLLKPNLVEPSIQAPHINTHPLFVRAVAEVFLNWDARRVFVAEGQGHCRDTYLVLEQSGLGSVLAEAGLDFIDLNHDDIYVVENQLRRTGAQHLLLPQTLQQADLIVSLPKLKIHHWVGMTLSMKNMFGVMPGICYGWPKNPLHVVGLPGSILDINAAVRPHLAIVDGIIGMEGDGPIMGTPKQSNVIIIGQNFPAVDATGARLMGLDPQLIPYLREAPGAGLGPIAESRIEQRGERIESLAQMFAMLDHPYMDQFRSPAAADEESISRKGVG